MGIIFPDDVMKGVILSSAGANRQATLSTYRFVGYGMKWLGKVAGGALGFVITGGPVGLVIGAALGHRFDQGFSQTKTRQYRSYSRTRRSSSNYRSLDERFLKITFRIMGHLAKADGRVSEEEIRAARGFMQQLALSPEQVKLVIACFNEGKSPGFPLQKNIRDLLEVCKYRRELVRNFLEIQVQAVLINGNITGPERAVLWQICRELNVSRVELAQIEALMRIRMANSEQSPPTQTLLSGAYEVLGIEASAADDEVKNQYRRLMNAHHPDKLQAQGLDEARIKSSTDKVHEIRAAYDTIKKSRGIR